MCIKTVIKSRFIIDTPEHLNKEKRSEHPKTILTGGDVPEFDRPVSGVRVQRHERTAGRVQSEAGDRRHVAAQRPPAVSSGQVPDAYVAILVAAKDAPVLGRYV